MSVPGYYDTLGMWLAALRGIHDVGDLKGLPAELRLEIFDKWLKAHQPPWDISRELRIPDWITPMYEDSWFRNTELILPAFTCPQLGIRHSSAMSLEPHAVSFLERLCRRPKAQLTRVSVEVVVDRGGDLRLSQDCIRRLLLVSYYLGAQDELLNMKVVVDTNSSRGKLEANKNITDPLKARLQDNCLTMQRFREGSMSMRQVYDSIGRAWSLQESQGGPPQNVVAAILGAHTSMARIYRMGTTMPTHVVLMLRCSQFMADVHAREIAAMAA
jgi:hypothetical protein